MYETALIIIGSGTNKNEAFVNNITIKDVIITNGISNTVEETF